MPSGMHIQTGADANKQHKIIVDHVFDLVLFSLGIGNYLIPSCLAIEAVKMPLTSLTAHIGVPQQTCVIMLHAMHLNLCGGIL